MTLKNDHVRELLRLLQSAEVAMSWLAEEIFHLIQAGKPSLSYEENQRGRKKFLGETTEAYSAEEEWKLALDVLETRVVEPSTYWNTALETVNEALLDKRDDVSGEVPNLPAQKSEPVTFSLVDDLRDQKEFRIVGVISRDTIRRLQKLIQEASEPEQR